MARASERNEGEARGAFNRKPEARHDRENSQRAVADGSRSQGFVPTISARSRMARASPCADRPISAQPTARAWLPVRFVRFCVRVGWLGSPCALGVGLGFIAPKSAKFYAIIIGSLRSGFTIGAKPNKGLAKSLEWQIITSIAVGQSFQA